MKKRIITTLAILTMLFGSMIETKAQIFLDDEDMQYNLRAGTLPENLPYIPLLDSTYDQYAPLGSGSVLLVGLAGAYFVCKRKKESKE